MIDSKIQPLVTVYITNYNYQDYLRESIDSVLNQSFKNFELLIIDDGSSDGSARVIEEYRSTRGVQIIYQKNKGLNVTNNVAMRVAKGKYIMRLDADDYLEKNALLEMVEVLENDKTIGLVFPNYYYVDNEGNRVGEELRHNFDLEVSLYDQPAHGACTMVRLEFLKRLGGYNEGFTCQDGYDLWLKFITHHRVTNIQKPLFSYRQHGKNLTSNENRILGTRRKIKKAFVEENFVLPSVVCIIPIREDHLGSIKWPMHDFNGKTILQRKVDTCLKAGNLSHIVLTSSDQELLGECSRIFKSNDKITILERPKEFEDPNQSLSKTIDYSLKILDEKNINVDAIMTAALEYPFLNSEYIDEVVHTLILFNADSVITVRPDNSIFYRHLGSGMVPILDQDKYTKLERDALYKGAGGIMLTKRYQFEDFKKSVSGKVAHVVVDNRTAFGVTDMLNLRIFDFLKSN